LLPPRIQLLLCREYNESSRRVPAVLSPICPNMLRAIWMWRWKPYSARFRSRSAPQSSRPIRLIQSFRVRNEAAATI